MSAQSARYMGGKATVSDSLDAIRRSFLADAPEQTHDELDLFLDSATCVSDVLTA